MNGELKLNLGCGFDARQGFVNVDRLALPGVDRVWDLRHTPWPWEDRTASTILALDVVEHLTDMVAFLDECWRVLEPGGALTVRVPRWDGENAWRDPTHVRAFHQTTFEYFDPDTEWGKKYTMYTQRKWRLAESRVEGADIVAVMVPRK